METNNNQNPDMDKEREYQEILEKATQSGHLEGIDTHVSNDAAEVMNRAKNIPLMGIKDNSTPGLGRGVDGTGVMGINQKNSTVFNPQAIEDDCACGDIEETTLNDAMEEVGD